MKHAQSAAGTQGGGWSGVETKTETPAREIGRWNCKQWGGSEAGVGVVTPLLQER